VELPVEVPSDCVLATTQYRLSLVQVATPSSKSQFFFTNLVIFQYKHLFGLMDDVAPYVATDVLGLKSVILLWIQHLNKSVFNCLKPSRTAPE